MPNFEDTLREAGLRVTRPRVAVLRVVHERPHVEASLVVDSVARALPGTSRQAIFDCLNTFTERGLLRRIKPDGSPARYELRTGDNHHHVVCRTCGTVADVDCAVGAAPCLQASDNHGFVIDEAEVTYWGVCSDCAQIRADSPA